LSGKIKKKSIEDLRIKAESGDLEAQSALGLLYELGLEVKPDPKESAKYWGMAAKTGDPMAQLSLANIISKEFEDTDEHRAIAQVLFKKAEEQGFVREDKAQRLLQRANGKSLKVLVIDDSITSRTPLKKYIEADGCEVIEAESGTDALAILKKDAEIKMVFSDLSMPGMDGLQLLKQMRSIDELKSIPVVVVTTQNQDLMVLKAKEIGIQGWIVKPARPHVLRRFLLKHT
jgi:two-component system chemotaxis response regulator CheY